MRAEDLSGSLTYEELVRIIEENGEPFDTIDQCRLYLRAASMYRRRVPEESEQGGERLRTRDVIDGMKEARRRMNILLVECETPTVITATDELS